MTIRTTHQEFLLLRDFIHNKSGIYLQENKKYLIENRLSGIARESGCKSFGEFYIKLKNSQSAEKLCESVVDAITTNETLWLRDQHPFSILEERILPQYLEKIKKGKSNGLKIWSAACSTGQEPYSIAMTSLNFQNKYGFKTFQNDPIKIFATDISGSAISVATKGQYDNNTMKRGMTPDFHKTYFKKEKNKWVINERVKNMITFKELNLKTPFERTMGPFDIVFLRNVIIYFSDELKKTLFNRIIDILSPGGYFFLGTGETITGYTDGFEPLVHNDAIYYKLKKNL
ncbi:MAG: protein-glutamate O-methyltransferase CheR [Desulfobacula sp.]|nr:protein-glutamate O-methyltransferase CheR [Desulfobacula sp.]